jgi:peptide deformylase
MAVRKIYKYGEEILKRSLKKVDFDGMRKELPVVIKDMFDTLDAYQGAGLAASQVGLDMRLAVIKIPADDDSIISAVLINPVMIEKSGTMFEEEGCLSFPGLFQKVKRFSKIKVHCLNEKGLPVEINASGFFAKAVQHEMDHLDGITFVDRLPLMARLKVKPALARIIRTGTAETDE